jgi:hypothetical protein
MRWALAMVGKSRTGISPSPPTINSTTMAEMEEIDNLDDAPSTPPPNTNNIAPNSIRRESTRLRTPILLPGFVPTSSDSRRAVIPPKKKTKKIQSSRATTTVIEDESGSESSNIVHTTNNSKRNARHKDGQQVFG